MSYEVWGDGPEPPTRWEQTAMRHDFDDVVSRFNKWKVAYTDEIPNTEMLTLIHKVEDALETLGMDMEGEC